MIYHAIQQIYTYETENGASYATSFAKLVIHRLKYVGKWNLCTIAL